MTIGATQTGAILGMAAYLAPEQARGYAVDKRAGLRRRAPAARSALVASMVDVLENRKAGGVAPAITGYRPASQPGRAGYGLKFTGPKLEVRWQQRKPRGPAAAPIIPGCCFATRRDAIEATGGWDDSQLQRGNIDNEGCVRFCMLGYELRITPDTVVAHKFRKRSPYPVGWPEYLFNRLRLAFVHFNPERLGKVVAGLRNYPEFGKALALLAESGLAQRRRELQGAPRSR